jgi:hypothetical protein
MNLNVNNTSWLVDKKPFSLYFIENECLRLLPPKSEKDRECPECRFVTGFDCALAFPWVFWSKLAKKGGHSREIQAEGINGHCIRELLSRKRMEKKMMMTTTYIDI